MGFDSAAIPCSCRTTCARDALIAYSLTAFPRKLLIFERKLPINQSHQSGARHSLPASLRRPTSDALIALRLDVVLRDLLVHQSNASCLSSSASPASLKRPTSLPNVKSAPHLAGSYFLRESNRNVWDDLAPLQRLRFRCIEVQVHPTLLQSYVDTRSRSAGALRPLLRLPEKVIRSVQV